MVDLNDIGERLRNWEDPDPNDPLDHAFLPRKVMKAFYGIVGFVMIVSGLFLSLLLVVSFIMRPFETIGHILGFIILTIIVVTAFIYFLRNPLIIVFWPFVLMHLIMRWTAKKYSFAYARATGQSPWKDEDAETGKEIIDRILDDNNK